MIIHNESAIKRNITFFENVELKKDISASAPCCWNCSWSIMTYEGLWCEKDMDEVNLRDLCDSWEGNMDIK